MISMAWVKELARRLDYLDAPLRRCPEYRGHISMAKEFGIINRESVFNPYGQPREKKQQRY